jgi:zinc finger protein
MAESKPEIVDGQQCPMCNKKAMTMMEDHREVPFFGKVYLFSMNCKNCKYHMADVESEGTHEPATYTYEITSEKDMQVRVIKSSQATVKIPHITTIEPITGSKGYISNIEGVFNRVKQQIEHVRDTEEDPALKKKAKNLLKKITRIMWGQEKQKFIIEDPSGNSAIISDKAVKKKMKG